MANARDDHRSWREREAFYGDSEGGRRRSRRDEREHEHEHRWHGDRARGPREEDDMWSGRWDRESSMPYSPFGGTGREGYGGYGLEAEEHGAARRRRETEPDYRGTFGDQGSSRWPSGPRRYVTERYDPEVGYSHDQRSRYGQWESGPHRGKGPKGYTRSDDRIREAVCDCLTDDPHIDASDIDVQVKSGEVTLSGTVAERAAKRHAEDLIDNISGVKHVQNSLRVKDEQTSGSPRRLRA